MSEQRRKKTVRMMMHREKKEFARVTRIRKIRSRINVVVRIRAKKRMNLFDYTNEIHNQRSLPNIKRVRVYLWVVQTQDTIINKNPSQCRRQTLMNSFNLELFIMLYMGNVFYNPVIMTFYLFYFRWICDNKTHQDDKYRH